MSKWLTAGAALAVAALIALPAPAGAAQQKTARIKQADQIEVSAARRLRMTVRPRWCGPHGRYCDAYRYGRRFHAPFAGYAFAYYYDRRPHFLPPPHVGFGPFGTGPYGFGSYQY
jgi:hypothetical protein